MERYECRTGGSNKFYEFETITNGNRITVNAYYGAIGRNATHVIIYDGDSAADALMALNKKIAEKIKKRYLLVGGSPTAHAPAPAVQKVAEPLPIIWPMKGPGVKDESHIASLIHDPNYIAQEKIDGERCIVFITETGLRLFSPESGVEDPTRPLEKKGYPFLNAISFPDLAGTILDSELIDGELFVFDILSFNGMTLGISLEERLKYLQTLPVFGEHISLLPYSRTTEEKQHLYSAVMASNGEGVMFKHRHGSYVYGGRPQRNWYKFKKSIEVDCVVMGFKPGVAGPAGSIIFGQYVDGELRKFGRASGYDKTLRSEFGAHPEKYIGRVMTVGGAKRFKSGAIRHPQFVKFRDDKPATACVYYPNEQ